MSATPEAAALLEKIKAQGDEVRRLKTEGGDAGPAVQALLSLKGEYKTLTGEDPPSSAPKQGKKKKKKDKSAPAPAAAAAPAAGGDEAAALLEKITAQGNEVRRIKGEGGDVGAAVKALLALKGDYKALTGQDPPSSAPKQGSKKDKKKQQEPAPAASGAPTGELSKKQLKKLEKEKAKEDRKKATAARVAAEQAAAQGGGDDQSSELYGNLPTLTSATRPGRSYTKVEELTSAKEGQTVLVRARVHAVREKSSKLTFLVLRFKQFTAQAVCLVNETVSKQMTKFAARLNLESLIDVEGTVVKPDVPVEGCSQKEVEIHISKLFCVSQAVPRLPVQVDDCGLPESDKRHPGQDVRLDNRILDLRATPNQAIFRIQSAVCELFRSFLLSQGFTEIHSPKLIGAASEGGANVFKLKYFGSDAFLAQSPQLYKQMAIASDFDRVFEVAPVFRAEDSNTHRHLTEFVGLDMEMAFYEHYHEVLDMLDQMFVSIFRGLQTRFAQEIETVNQQFPRKPFRWLEPSLRLEWPEAIAMLRESGEELGDFDDLSTPQEVKLGKLVAEKYETDFYVLDKFPLCIRPFYTMPDPHSPGYSNSYDFFMRGEEIMSGAQRIHDPVLLEERARVHGIPLSGIQSYVDAFKYGCSPHAGGGVGLERVAMLFLGLPNIRRTSLFPRTPNRCAP
eukprot:m.75541 g.75541  ORF g.75541 m.75541 type:complete len:677 (-) comp14485_c0_seq1:103-2133(-)